MRTVIHKLDSTVESYASVLPQWLLLPMTIASFLGQPIVTMGILIGIGLYGLTKHHSGIIVASMVGAAAIVINSALKFGFGRDRPKTDYVANMWFDTFSFPSGHSCGAMVAYGLLAYLAWHSLPMPYSLIVVSLLSLLILLIGFSRIYLGAHYASDVIGGWIIGLIGLCIIIFIIKPL